MRKSLEGLNIFLIGMMGSGKTTVGKAVAQAMNYRFFDTDVLIERVKGKSINEIFAEEGEESFRQLETQVLMELSAYQKSVVATGGGIVLQPMNWSHLHQGLIVWLNVPVEVLVQRLIEDNTRPLLQNEDLTAKLTELREQRQLLYAQADLKIAVNAEQTPEDIARVIVEQIPTVLKEKATPPILN